MRLIAMSSHSRLKNKQEPLMQYMAHMSTLFANVHAAAPSWHNPKLNPPSNIPAKHLIILVGSQKGLCGNFNANLFHFFNRTTAPYARRSFDIIAIGKKATDFVKNTNRSTVLSTHETFSLTNLFSLSQILVDIIMQADQPYTSVIIVSNKLRGFFMQKPYDTSVIPFNPEAGTAEPPKEGYVWEQSATATLDVIAKQYLEATIQLTLFQSLYAEHAARFLSMDNSTRNANNLLEATKLQYNKLRQAKITKELTELSGSF